MIKIIGVRFRNAGKIYYFSPESMEMKTGDNVIVETARGIECGRVVLPPSEVDENQIVQPLKSVIRVATPEDLAHAAENRRKAKEAFFICKQRIRKHDLDMKLIDAEYTFDNKKALFYFTADGRVDFRELIKDLASVFKTRIELRQIGVRDETKILGGYGICGRPLCCSAYLSDFAPVSIKMAKEQNLSLNPTKISGVCGRLMCCLKNEEETYEYLNCKMPNVGDTVKAPDGTVGEIISVDILKQEVRVIIQTEDDNKEVEKYLADDLTVIARRRKGRGKKPVQEQPMTEVGEDVLRELEDQTAEDLEKTRSQNEKDTERKFREAKGITEQTDLSDKETDEERQDVGTSEAFEDVPSETVNVENNGDKGGKISRQGRRNRDRKAGNGANSQENRDKHKSAEGNEASEAPQNNRAKGKKDQRRRNGQNKPANSPSRRENQGKDDSRRDSRRNSGNGEDRNREMRSGEDNRGQKETAKKERVKDGSGNRRNHGRDRRGRERAPKEQVKDNNAENK